MLGGASQETLSGERGHDDRFLTRTRTLAAMADVLEGKGDPQGEYVRLEIRRQELERLYEGLSLPSRRAIELFHRHGVEWKKPLLEKGALHVEFNCGVPEQVWISGANFLKQGEELLNTSTVTTIVLRDVDGETLKGLSKCAWLPQVQSLVLNNNSLTTYDIEMFCRNWKKPGMRELHLQGNWLTESVLPYLMESAGATKLHTLDLSTNQITGKNIPLTGGVSGTHSLEVVDLSGNPMGNHGGRRVIYHGIPGSVKDLRVNHSLVGNNLLLALAEYRSRMSLRYLSYSGNAARPRGLRELCCSSGGSTLETLNVSFNQITSQNLRKILDDDSLRHLEGLSLANNVLSADSIRMFCMRAAPLDRLRRLDFSAIALKGRCMIGLGCIAHLHNLEVLTLRGCGLTANDAHVLAELDWPPGLKILDLRNNAIGGVGVASLIQSRLWEKGCRILISDVSVDEKLIRTARHVG